MTEEKTKDQNKFKNTLNLPRTDFPIRANYKQLDPQMLQRWQEEDIYRKTFISNESSKKFILHDGPPYANGNIHLGHAYNKILKDMVCKGHRMAGFGVPVTPGWDCHGLPIELKVSKENPDLNKLELKAKCREYAQFWIDVQRKEFKQLGVFMNWSHPYITMSPDYESKTLKALSFLVKDGYVERKNKTVPWCANDKTVLAQAEIEYKDRKDPSIYVQFDLLDDDAKKIVGQTNASLLVWTTTPWTLPLNRAVLVKPNAQYSLIKFEDKYILVGNQVAQSVIDMLNEKLSKENQKTDVSIIGQIKSEKLSELKVKHPFTQKLVPLIFDESVGLTEGTAFVHCAPGCGPIDYEIGIKNNLEIFSPVSADGRYTSEIGIPELVNMPVSEGQVWVIKKLLELDKLLIKKSIMHSYPHCWRCYNGLIFRATPQWFIDLQASQANGLKTHGSIKEKALTAINNIKFLPEQGKNFLKATIENRWEWCISRQRIWGVPIPALICNKCDKAFTNADLINKIAAGVQKEGIEYWDRITIQEIVNITAIKACPTCACITSDIKNFRKETDILDVWFDSGISHFAVLFDNPELAYPADIYLEGVDQHRGWFQSSLLTSLVIEKEACTKSIATHGFTVDAKGQKMSKSKGNVILPQQIIDQLGTDGLRLWAATSDYSGDPVVSDVLLKNVGEVGRKIRNTCRFLLSNLYDFDFEKDAIQPNKLLAIDNYALVKLAEFNATIVNYYLNNDFTAVFHGLTDYTTVELSSFYLDIVKDRLYTQKVDGHARRSAQTVAWLILDTVNKLIAPILSFTAELISDFYQKDKQESIHLQLFNNPKVLYNLALDKTSEYSQIQKQDCTKLLEDIKERVGLLKDKVLKQILSQWQIVKDIRSALLKQIEIQREQGVIKHSLEAKVKFFVDLNNSKFKALENIYSELKKKNSSLAEFWSEVLIVSQVELLHDNEKLLQTELPGVYAIVEHAQGVKCPRCWQWDITHNVDHLCRRCQKVLE